MLLIESSLKTPVTPHTCVAYNGHNKIVWSQLRTDVYQLSNDLKTKISYTTQPRAILYCERRYSFLVALLACMECQIDVLLSPHQTPTQIKQLEPQAQILLSDIQIQAGIFNIPILHPMQPDATTRERQAPNTTAPTLDLFGFKLCLFTSGSTGAAQAIVRTWPMLMAEINALETQFSHLCAPHSITLCSASHQHVYGLIFGLLWPLLSGRPFFDDVFLYPETLFAHLRFWHTTDNAPMLAYLASTPSYLQQLQAHPDFASHAQLLGPIFSSAQPLSTLLAQSYYTQTGHTPIEILGSTETGAIAFRQQIENNPTPWQTFKDVFIHTHTSGDESGQSIDQLAIRSPFFCSLPVKEQPWFITQDAIKLQDTQHFFLIRRTDRHIKVDGKRIFLDTLESHLKTHPYIKDVSVFPITTPQNGLQTRTQLACLVQLQDFAWLFGQAPAHTWMISQLKQHLATQFEDLILPKKWAFVRNIPNNQQGKRPLDTLVQALKQNQTNKILTMPHLLSVSMQSLTATPEHQSIQSHLVIPEDLYYLKGHFDDFSVVPGVVQIQWAKAFIELQQQRVIHLSHIEALKFNQVMTPKEAIFLSIDLHQTLDNNQTPLNKAHFQFKNHAQKSFSSGRFYF